MKKCLPVLALLMAAGTVSAQITVTNATFPVAGDTLRTAIDYAPPSGISVVTPPGGGQTWDLSGLEAEATQEIIYRPANGGTVGAQVPGAELYAVLSPATETYYNVTDTKFELQAYWGVVPYDLVANNLFEYYPPIAERRAPLNFFDINANSSGFLELFEPSAFSPLSILQLAAQTNNAQIDSMRYRLAVSEVSAVDAYGTMSIPGGSFDVLREKRTQYTETRIDAKIPPLGWLDITDNAIQAGFFGLGADTTVSYYFHNDVAKEPIAIVTLNNQQNAAEKVVFKNTTPPVINAIKDAQVSVPTVFVSPNPASDKVMFDFKNLVSGEYRLAILDENGRVALEQTMQLSDGQSERMNLSRLSPGVYFISVFDENGRVVCREKLMKQ